MTEQKASRLHWLLMALYAALWLGWLYVAKAML